MTVTIERGVSGLLPKDTVRLLRGQRKLGLVLAADDTHTVVMRRDRQMDNDIGKAPGVVLPRDSDFGEVPLVGKWNRVAVEQAKTFGRQRVVVGWRPAGGSGVAPATYPPSLAEFLKPPPDARRTCERSRECPAQFQQLLDCQRRAVECGQDVEIAREEERDGICHREGLSIA